MPLIYADAKHNDNFSVIDQLFVNLVDLFRISCLLHLQNPVIQTQVVQNGSKWRLTKCLHPTLYL